MNRTRRDEDLIAGLERVPGSPRYRLTAYFIGSAGFSVDNGSAREHCALASLNHNEIRFLRMDLGPGRSHAMNHDRRVHQSLYADMRLGIHVGCELLIDRFHL